MRPRRVTVPGHGGRTSRSARLRGRRSTRRATPPSTSTRSPAASASRVRRRPPARRRRDPHRGDGGAAGRGRRADCDLGALDGAVAALEAERRPRAACRCSPRRSSRSPRRCAGRRSRARRRSIAYAGLRDAARQPAMPTAAAVRRSGRPAIGRRAARRRSEQHRRRRRSRSPRRWMRFPTSGGADHQSILWCKQLAVTLARAFASLAVALDQAHPAPLPSQTRRPLRRALLLAPDDGDDDADDNCARCVPYAHCAEKCVDNAWPCPEWERCVARGSEAVEAERRRSLRGSLTLTLLASPLGPRRCGACAAPARCGAARRGRLATRYAAAVCGGGVHLLAALAYGGGARVTLGLTAAAAISAGARAGGALCAAPRRWLGGLGGRNVAVARVASPSRRSRRARLHLGGGRRRRRGRGRERGGAARRRCALALARSRRVDPELRRAPWRVRGWKKWSDDARHLAFLLLLTLPLPPRLLRS